LKKSILIILFAFPCISFCIDYSPMAGHINTDPRDFPSGRVIRSTDFEPWCANMNDLINYISDFTFYTTDGFSFHSAIAGSSPMSSDWEVFIDGVLFPMNRYNGINLELLQVSLNQVTAIRIIDTPQLHKGRIISSGAIHLYTQRPRSKLSVGGTYSAGNETGDPGPFLYTDDVVSNVDKNGPYHYFSVSSKINKLRLSANYKNLNHFTTDQNLLDRTSWIGLGAYPKMEMDSYGIDLGWGEYSDPQIDLKLGFSDFDSYSFLYPAISEIPAGQEMLFIGLSAKTKPAGKVTYEFSGSYSDDKLTAESNALGLDFDIVNRNLDISVQRIDKSHRIYWTIGSGFIGKWREDGFGDGSWGSGRIFCEADQLIGGSYQIREIYRIINSASIEGCGGEYYLKALSSVSTPNPVKAYKLQISYLEDIPSFDAFTFDNTMQNDGSSMVTGVHQQPFYPGKDRKISANLNFVRYFESRLKKHNIMIDASYTRFLNASYCAAEYCFINDSGCFFDEDADIRETSGSTASLGLTVNHAIYNKPRHSFDYNFTVPISVDQLFLDTWEKFPSHKITYSMSIEPDKTFTIMGRLTYASNTVWVDFRDLDDSVDWRLEPVYYCDLSFRKKFWRGKVSGSLNFRNVFNQTVKYHPLGAEFDLAYYLKVTVNLEVIKK